MDFRIYTLIFISLFFLTFCESQTSLNNHGVKSHTSSTNIEQRAAMDTSKMEKRDGLWVIPTPGTQIDKDKVDAVLIKGNVSYSDILTAEGGEEIRGNIEKLEKLLENKRVINDKELQFSVHGILGTQFLRLYKKSKNQAYLDQAIDHTDTAITIFENKPKYKADLAPVYTIRVAEYGEKKQHEKAKSIMKYLIEEYQGIGYGPYKNWFASYQVGGLYNLARMDSSKSGRSQEVMNYIKELAERYNNEVGIAAQISLAQYYFRKGDEDRLRSLSKSIENRLISLNNPAFKKDKWESFKNYMEQMEKNRNTH